MNLNPIKSVSKTQLFTQAWRGLNRTERCADGEFRDMINMTGDHYPLMATRKKRGKMDWPVPAPVSCILDKPGVGVFYACDDYDTVRIFFARGAESAEQSYLNGAIDASSGNGRTALISMGAYVIVWPQGIVINTAEREDGHFKWSTMDASFTAALSDSQKMQVRHCDRDGNIYENATVSATEPANPADNKIWIDTTDTANVVGRRWSASMVTWVVIPQVYTRLDYPGIGHNFKQGDAVQLSGRAAGITGWNVLEKVEDDYVVITFANPTAGYWGVGEVTVERKHPDMEFITECDNRLWGCHYGLVDGKLVNEIYASALGDPTNWRQYRGISTDSYAASRGSDGAWTGAITYQGKPHFFKRNCVEIVYPSSDGAHQIATNQCRGVQPSMPQNSLAICRETLLYYTGTDVVAYTGSDPSTISDQLGSLPYDGSTAGVIGSKYYLCLKKDAYDEAETGLTTGLWVYDLARGFWHKEDGIEVTAFGGDGTRLYMADSHRNIWRVDSGPAMELEPDFKWMAETGEYGLDTPGKKYLGKFLLRLNLERGAWLDMDVQYDSTGVWEPVGHVECSYLQTKELAYTPRRCDHIRFRFSGKGACKVYSFAREQRGGTAK